MPELKNILLIRLKSIGDVVFTLPAVNVIRDNFPAAKITFLTSKENAPLLAGFREVNEVIRLDRAAFRGANPLKVIPQFFGLLRHLHAGKFDLVVDFQGYGETAWLARLTGAPQRWGSVYGKGRKWAYTLGVVRDDALHHADRSLAILLAGGLKIGAVRNEFVLPEAAVNDARAWFADQRLDLTKPVIYFQPFTSTPHKNWPFENYLVLANHWRAHGVQVIIGGGPADQPLLDQARSLGFAVPDRLPRLTDAGLMKLSTLIVGGDTGFMHLAVAMGKRVIMLMNLQGPGSAVPFRHPEWVVAPQTGSLLAEVTTKKVIDAVGSALAAVRPGN
jgi:ADP-heptose:LPS heptosyltransferase